MPGFVWNNKNDLFLSYRRDANELLNWVDVFFDHLCLRLKEMVSQDVWIWRDVNDIPKGRNYLEAVYEAIDAASIFLMAECAGHFESNNCIDELNRFCNRIKIGADEGPQIFPVLKQPLDPNSAPQEIEMLQAYKFYREMPGKTPAWRELDLKGSKADLRYFNACMLRLVADIKSALRAIDGHGPSRGKVFIGRVCIELEYLRDELRTQLQADEYKVVPRNDYFWNANDIADKIASDLVGASLSIHLITSRLTINDYGKVEPAERFASRSRRQLTLAQEAMRQKGGPRSLVWIQPLDPEHPSPQDTADLIRFVQRDLANSGVEWLDCSLQDLKARIDEMLPAQGQG